MEIELDKIDLAEDDLLFPAKYIEKLGGKDRARIYLLDIIDRYFNSEYIDFECWD